MTDQTPDPANANLPNDPDAAVGLRYLGEPTGSELSEDIGETVEPARYQPEDASPDPDAVQGSAEQPPIYSHRSSQEDHEVEAGPSLTTGLDPVQADEFGLDPEAVAQAE